ncbi:MAG: hypothetical protein OXN15_07835 [Chloroflexota bacterium]|nr:hypothetical protein [Chloroflexota bacterium]MDE2968934.1 hypothetical protein [Chloroflexota bacterium]
MTNLGRFHTPCRHSRSFIFASLLATALALVEGLACVSPKLAPEEMPLAGEILASSAAAMNAVQTGSVLITRVGVIEGQGKLRETRLVVEGEFIAPFRSRYTARQTGDPGDIDVSVISINSDSFVLDAGTGEWKRGQDPLRLVDWLRHLGAVDLHPTTQRRAFDKILLREEILNGDRVYYLKLDLPISVAGRVVADARMAIDSAISDVTIELWIGVEDFLLHRLTTKYEANLRAEGETITERREMNFSRLNGMVEINLPEVDHVGGVLATDDHGDEHTSATVMSPGDVVEGVTEYLHDYDYFSFRAQAGKSYRIVLSSERRGSFILGLVSPSGVDDAIAAFNYRGQDLALTFEASSSGEYYVNVHDWSGYTLPYTLSLT